MEKLEPQSSHCYVLPNSLNILHFKRLCPYLEYAGETQYGLSSAALACRKMASRGLLSSVLSKAMFFTMYDDRVPPWVPTRPPRPVPKEKNQIRNAVSIYLLYTGLIWQGWESLTAGFRGGRLNEWQSRVRDSGLPDFCHSLQNQGFEHSEASNRLWFEAHKSQEYLSIVLSAFIYDNQNQSRTSTNLNCPITFLNRDIFYYALVA